MSSTATLDVEAVLQIEATHVLPTYERYPVLLTHGRGCYAYDAEGKEYLDLLSGIGVTALGHAHPAVTEAITKQSARLIHTSNLFFHEFQSELAAKLAQISGLDRAFFCNSGTEAVEGALKLARAYAKAKAPKGAKPKWRILAMENSFHGRTFGSVSATWTKKYREPFGPLVPGVKFLKSNNIADFDKKFDDSVCAVLLEPIQGEGGIRSLNAEFFAHVREKTLAAGAVLIADEIQCGMGRTGEWFGYQTYGITPDVVTVAKPIANGLPLGAILVGNEIASAIHPGMHGTTFGGGPLVCAVALAVLDTIEKENLLSHNAAMGAYFRDRLMQLKGKYKFIRDVRGVGLMVGVELDTVNRAKAVVKEGLTKGIIVNRTNDKVIRMLPPFIIQSEQIDHAIAALDSIFSQSKKANVK